MKINLLIIFSFFFLSFSCSKTRLKEIDPLSFFYNEISLSDMADDIRYIPLDSSIYISNLLEIKILGNAIFLSSQTKYDGGIYAYDEKGMLTGKIEGIQGSGPGECTNFHNFTVDTLRDRIYIADAMQKEIEVYSIKNKYLRTISLKEKIKGFTTDIVFWNSYLILGYSGSDEYNWVVVDTLGNWVGKKKNSLYPYDCNIGLLGGFYKYNHKIHFWDPFNDTVFMISPNLKYEAKYLFKRGTEWVPPVVMDISKLTSLFKIYNIFETKKYIYLSCGYQKEQRIAIIEKEKGKGYLSSGHGIHNTLDGGLALKQCDTYYKKNGNEYFVGVIQPYELKAHVASETFKNSRPKYPEKKKELEKLANSLNENDNPVLMLVTLKN